MMKSGMAFAALEPAEKATAAKKYDSEAMPATTLVPLAETTAAIKNIAPPVEVP